MYVVNDTKDGSVSSKSIIHDGASSVTNASRSSKKNNGNKESEAALETAMVSIPTKDSQFSIRLQNKFIRLFHLHRKNNKKETVILPSIQNKLLDRVKMVDGIAAAPRKSSLDRSTIGVSAPSDISIVSMRRGSAYAYPKFKHDIFVQKTTRLTKRRSSTSTAFYKDTIGDPNPVELLLCISKALYYHIVMGMQVKVKIHEDIFSEKTHPMGKEKINFTKAPNLDKIYHHLKSMFEVMKTDHQVVIMFLAYVEKFLEYSKLTFDATNWRRITLTAFIIAEKAWNDLAVWNDDFLNLFKGFVRIRDLNALEAKFLHLIQYKVFLKSSTYTKYYFELKAFTTLEDTRFQSQRCVTQPAMPGLCVPKTRRSMSLGSVQPLRPNAPVILN